MVILGWCILGVFGLVFLLGIIFLEAAFAKMWDIGWRTRILAPIIALFIIGLVLLGVYLTTGL